MEQIKIASLKSRDIIKRLLNFSRPTDLKRKPVKIISVIKDCLDLLSSVIPNNVEVLRGIPDDSEIVLVDSTQIHQVIVNLCTNAIHAMSEGKGVLEVSLSSITIDNDVTIQSLECGKYVKITVKDTGYGITEENIDKIFDPYFTTKEVGKGSGVGLAVVRGIVNGHEGAILVDSECGEGTTFNVFLPVYKEWLEVENKINTPAPKGTERV